MKLSCHCKNIIIAVDKPNQVTQCNCSICSRYMSLWGYYSLDQPIIEIGIEGTDAYCWGDQEIDFMRCAKCGCITHYITKAGVADPRIGINFSLDRELVQDVPVRYFDGASKL